MKWFTILLCLALTGCAETPKKKQHPKPHRKHKTESASDQAAIKAIIKSLRE